METKQRSRLNKALASSVLLGSLLTSSSVFAVCNADITLTKPDSLYQDNLDGSVTDLDTGLMWQKCSQGQIWSTGSDANDPTDDSCDNSATTLTWQAALDTAQSANANASLGHDDWYLPNKKELGSLVEKACYNPAINSTLFPATVNSYYWSASPDADYSTYAWVVYFGSGYEASYPKNITRYVRLVRASQ